VFGAFGLAWVSSIVLGLILTTDAPWPTKLAWGEYGTIGLIYFVGVIRGRHRDATWERRMHRALLVGFTVAIGLFALGWSHDSN
jgi:hypothetical protein